MLYWFNASGEIAIQLEKFKPYVYMKYESVVNNGSVDHTGYAGGGFKMDVPDRIDLGFDAYSNFSNPEADELGGGVSVSMKSSEMAMA